MNTVHPELVEGLCFDKLSTNGVADKPGRINMMNATADSCPTFIEAAARMLSR
jgi:hypothetical protein